MVAAPTGVRRGPAAAARVRRVVGGEGPHGIRLLVSFDGIVDDLYDAVAGEMCAEEGRGGGSIVEDETEAQMVAERLQRRLEEAGEAQGAEERVVYLLPGGADGRRCRRVRLECPDCVGDRAPSDGHVRHAVAERRVIELHVGRDPLEDHGAVAPELVQVSRVGTLQRAGQIQQVLVPPVFLVAEVRAVDGRARLEPRDRGECGAHGRRRQGLRRVGMLARALRVDAVRCLEGGGEGCESRVIAVLGARASILVLGLVPQVQRPAVERHGPPRTERHAVPHGALARPLLYSVPRGTFCSTKNGPSARRGACPPPFAEAGRTTRSVFFRSLICRCALPGTALSI